MGRTSIVERGTAVRAAREVFWRSGYEAAGIHDLEEATGMKRSSIYHAFGSKRGLFDAAVQSYLDEVIRPRLAPLCAPQVEASSVLDYLGGLRAALTAEGSSPARNGCLLVNAAASPLAQDPEVSGIVAAYREELHGAIGRGIASLRASRAAGTTSDVPAPADADILTDAVTGLVISAFALTRIAPQEAIRSLDAAIGLLGQRR